MSRVLHKFVSSGVVADATLGDRQVRIIASDASVDRDGDVLDPAGADLTGFRLNPVFLCDHRPEAPIGTVDLALKNYRLTGVVTFAPKGVSAIADERAALMKAGICKGISVGFSPKTWTPRDGGGRTYTAWELLECSSVSIPANPGALVVERALKDGRVLAGVHADALERAHRRLCSAAVDVKGVLAAAGRTPSDDLNADDEDDQELAFSAARRKRLLAIAARVEPPLSAGERAALDRARLIQRARVCP